MTGKLRLGPRVQRHLDRLLTRAGTLTTKRSGRNMNRPGVPQAIERDAQRRALFCRGRGKRHRSRIALRNRFASAAISRATAERAAWVRIVTTE